MNSAMTEKPPAPAKGSKVLAEPGGWERFEIAVDAALHTTPKHNAKVKPESKAKPKGS